MAEKKYKKIKIDIDYIPNESDQWMEQREIIVGSLYKIIDFLEDSNDEVTNIITNNQNVCVSYSSH